MKKVFASEDRTTIEVVRNLLLQEKIETTVLNEASATAMGGIPFFNLMPEVWALRDEDEPRALEIVGGFESGAAREAQSREAWTCPECGEEIEGQFTECWNCHVAAAADPRQDPEATCEKCGYRLWGLPERRCPECWSEI